MNVQIIEKNGKPEWAVIPFQDYKKLQKALEDAEDIKDIEENLKAVVEVLTQIGWILESKQVSMREVSTDTLEVHKEIIPLLIAVLGTAAIPVTAMIISVLKSLADMDKDQPWITLFDRESQRASANQFQMSYASVDENAGPRISLVCFELDASRSLTQVLFFKFSTTKATLRHFGSKFGINPDLFERSIKVVEDRIADYVNDYVEDIKL